MEVANPFELLYSKISVLQNSVNDLTEQLKQGFHNRTVVSADRFCNVLEFMSLSRFHREAPAGNVPGAVKLGRKWFVDLAVFEKALKNGDLVKGKQEYYNGKSGKA